MQEKAEHMQIRRETFLVYKYIFGETVLDVREFIQMVKT